LHLTFRSKATEAPGYRPDIDGLRAIAVLSVVFYHAAMKGFSGGFVGVDIFFVISGYLITRVIEGDMQKERFTFLSFYERRIRRIFPALFAVALFCVVVGAKLFPPQQYKDFGKSLLAVTGFVSNLYFKTTSVGTGYFEPSAGAQFLLHTWSLSLEEQFYVLFPILLLLLHKYLRERRKLVVAVLIAVSFALNLLGMKGSPIATFYLIPGRAWELLLGALLAMNPFPSLRHALLRTAVCLAGIVSIAYAVVFFTQWDAFPGYRALFPCIGAMLVLYAGEDGASPLKSVLSFRPLVFIGVISYSLYLWHWPILALARSFYAMPTLNFEQAMYPMLASFVVAFLSFEFIESPFRKRHAAAFAPKHTAVWRGIGVSAAFAILAIGIIATNGVPKRFHTEKRALLDINYAKKGDMAAIGDCGNWHTDVQKYSDVHFCSVGLSSKNILFWGDSHVSQLYPVLTDLQRSNAFHGEGVVFAISAACPPAEHYNLTREGYHCDRFTHFALERAAKDDIDTVFIEFSPWWAMVDGTVCATQDGRCTQSLGGPEAEERVVAELAGHIHTLKALGKRVIVGLPFPFYTQLIPDYLIRNLTFGRYAKYGPMPFDLSSIIHTENLRAAAVREGADVYDPRQTLCLQKYCTIEVNGISLYADQGHLAASQTWFVRDGLLKVLQPH
jgi:peptidoglycan/LPS O-acetylase OafA/YrhL